MNLDKIEIRFLTRNENVIIALFGLDLVGLQLVQNTAFVYKVPRRSV
jgi:hypothetical protein